MVTATRWLLRLPPPDTWSHALIHDDVEPALVEHTGRSNRITGRHTGRGFVRECARTHAHHDQSMPCHDGAWRRHGHEVTLGSETSEDVEGDRERISKIRARHLTVTRNHLHGHAHGGRWTRVGDARAGSGPQKSGSHHPGPPRSLTQVFRSCGCLLNGAALGSAACGEAVFSGNRSH